MSLTDKALKVVAERPALVPARPAVAVFSADRPGAASGSDPRAAFIAELMLHQATETPLAIGLFGPAGAGKSSLLRASVEAAAALGRAAEAAGLATTFVARSAVLTLEAQPGADPYATLLRQAHAGLAVSHPELAATAVHLVRDPEAAAREADDRLSTSRHRLDAERQRLDELTARQARLVDAVLLEGTGSRLDAYARANRGRIDRALRRFGFTGDASVTYRELVRDAAEPGFGRGLGWLSAFWAYRGQMRLIGVALAFFVLAWLSGALLGGQQDLLDALRASNDKMGPVADWLGAHAGWLAAGREVLNIAGVAALVTNVVRAARFVQPIARGATLLRGDLDARRHDLDGIVAHQAQRVEAMAREVEQASGRAAEAGRLVPAGVTAPPAPTLPDLGETRPVSLARSFFAGIADALVGPAERGEATRAPARLIVALDGLEHLPPRDAAAFLEAAHLCLARPGVVLLVAAEPDHLMTGLAEADPALARAMLERMIQVPMVLGDGDAPGWPGVRPLVRALLRTEELDGTTLAPEPGRSLFDKPWLAKEEAVLEALSPFAGRTPRALKRFVNLYRIARADPALAEGNAADLAALAIGLALVGTGDLPPASLLDGASPLGGGLQAARHAASTALGVAIDLGRNSRGLDVARRYAVT